MNLDDVYRIKTPRRKRKRIGRGPGSGSGKTSGKGHKGASSRSGWGGLTFYEGGQMPLFRRLPRRGFSNQPFKVEYDVVNVEALDERFADGDTVDREAMVRAGLLRSSAGRIKILGTGELTKKLVVIADKFSKSAREKIEAKGGEARDTGK